MERRRTSTSRQLAAAGAVAAVIAALPWLLGAAIVLALGPSHAIPVPALHQEVASAPPAYGRGYLLVGRQ